MNEKRIRFLKSLPDGVIHRRPGSMQELLVNKEQTRLQLIFQNEKSTIIQAEMEIAKPFSLYDGFTQALTLWLAWRPEPRKALLIGYGGGRIPTVLHHHFPELIIQCAEIDEDVVEVAREYFFAPSDANVPVVIEDGSKILGDVFTGVFDGVMIDAFDGDGNTPDELSTPEFYQRCCEHLAADGVVAVNIMPSDDAFESKLDSFQSSFDYGFFVNIPAEGTIVLIGGRGESPKQKELISCAKQLEKEHHFQHPFTQHVKNFKLIHEAKKLRRKRRKTESN